MFVQNKNIISTHEESFTTKESPDSRSFTDHKIQNITKTKMSLCNTNKKVKLSSEIDLRFKQISSPNDSSPFYESDLIIFPDDYQGLLPLNGIREKNYHEIVILYQSILDNKTVLKVEGTKEFKNLIIGSIKKLLTRKVGRKLFNNLLKREADLLITEGDIENKSEYKYKENKVILDTNKCFVYTRLFNGLDYAIEMPVFITLAHELTHVLHEIEGSVKEHKKAEPTLDKAHGNLEEQKTITGFCDDLPVFEENKDNPLKNFNPKKIKYYYINENSFRTAFGLPFRANHLGGITHKIPDNIVAYNFREKHILVPKIKVDFSTKDGKLGIDASNYIKDLICNGCKNDLEKAIKAGLDVNSKTENGMTLLELNMSLFTWNREIAALLIKYGAEVNPKNSRGRTLLWITSSKVSMNERANFLREMGATIEKDELSFEPEDGVTDLMKYMFSCDRSSIEIQMKKENPLSLTKQGLSAIAYCIKSRVDESDNWIIFRALDQFIKNLPEENIPLVLNFLIGNEKQTFLEWLKENKSKINQKMTPKLYELLVLY